MVKHRNLRRLTTTLLSVCCLLILCWRSSTAQQPDVYVALVTNKVPEFSGISWILELALISFLRSFRMSSKQVHLAVYMQCTTTALSDAQPYNTNRTEPGFAKYIETVRETVEKLQSKVASLEFYCTSSLGQAVCHSRKGMMQASMTNGIFFLLEHDWIILPSQIGVSIEYIKRSLSNKAVEYILLQRGDRAEKSTVAGYGKLRITDLYSNNPYFASFSFLTRLVEESDLCQRVSDVRWERLVEKYCKMHECSLSVLGVNTKGSALYHIDGRFLSTAKRHSVGILFNDLHEAVKRYITSTIDAATFINYVDMKCRKLPSDCDPYFHRRYFPTLIRPLVMERAGHGQSLEEVIAEFTGEDPNQFLSGKFKGRKELEDILNG